MSEPIQPMADETIDSVVRMVEAAELLAQSLDCSCSKAMRVMLKSMQVMQRMQSGQGASALMDILSATKRVQ